MRGIPANGSAPSGSRLVAAAGCSPDGRRLHDRRRHRDLLRQRSLDGGHRLTNRLDIALNGGLDRLRDGVDAVDDDLGFVDLLRGGQLHPWRLGLDSGLAQLAQF